MPEPAVNLYLIYACAAAGLCCLVFALSSRARPPAQARVDPMMAEQLQKIRASRPEF